MARNDGIDRTVARNQDLETPADVAKVQEHNEREKDSYSNQDIVPERTSLNVHFKAPTDDYVKMFEQMEQDGVISTRGLKPDAVKYGELIFDVNSAYFYNHGGYEFAKEFYADAYKAAVEIVGGEQYMFQLRRKSKQFLEYDTGRRESVLIQENSAVIRRPKGQRIEVGTSGLRDNQALWYRPAQLQAGWTCGDDEELLPPVLVRQRTPQARGGRAGLSSPFRPKRNAIGSRAKQKRNGRCRIPQWKR